MNAGPIYAQIVREVERMLANGSLKPGEKLPSARELAAELGVNPNTIIHAYGELESKGLSETRRGLGTFIREDVPVGDAKQKRLKQAAMQYWQEVQGLGYSVQEALEALKEVQHDR